MHVTGAGKRFHNMQQVKVRLQGQRHVGGIVCRIHGVIGEIDGNNEGSHILSDF